MKITFEQWFLELKRVAAEFGWRDIGDAESWRDYYDEDFDPGTAWHEQLEYAAQES